jgi:hypothetical protein
MCASLCYAQAYGVRKEVLSFLYPALTRQRAHEDGAHAVSTWRGYSHSSPVGDWTFGIPTSPRPSSPESFWFAQPLQQAWLGLTHVFTQNEPTTESLDV